MKFLMDIGEQLIWNRNFYAIQIANIEKYTGRKYKEFSMFKIHAKT